VATAGRDDDPDCNDLIGGFMNTTRNWKTTIFGILMLAISGFSIYNDPTKAMDPQIMTTIAGGVGLILAKDGDKTGTAQTPETGK
jgi:hypothetical protein